MTKLAVVGSRTFTDEELLSSILHKFDKKSLTIISGGAMGADKLAENWAKRWGVKTIIFKPDYKKYGRKAGIIRNKDIIENADQVIAFWDGKSPGTKNSIDRAEKRGIKVDIHYF